MGHVGILKSHHDETQELIRLAQRKVKLPYLNPQRDEFIIQVWSQSNLSSVIGCVFKHPGFPAFCLICPNPHLLLLTQFRPFTPSIPPNPEVPPAVSMSRILSALVWLIIFSMQTPPTSEASSPVLQYLNVTQSVTHTSYTGTFPVCPVVWNRVGDFL